MGVEEYKVIFTDSIANRWLCC